MWYDIIFCEHRLAKNDWAIAILLNKECFKKHCRGWSKDSISLAVCQKMFLQVFDLPLKKVRKATDKKTKDCTGICSWWWQREAFKTSTFQRRQMLRDHINMFLAYKGHYFRSHTKQKLPFPTFIYFQNVWTLHSALYRKKCSKSTAFYTKIFEFSLAFKKKGGGGHLQQVWQVWDTVIPQLTSDPAIEFFG
jgi:hypothetical protein